MFQKKHLAVAITALFLALSFSQYANSALPTMKASAPKILSAQTIEVAPGKRASKMIPLQRTLGVKSARLTHRGQARNVRIGFREYSDPRRCNGPRNCLSVFLTANQKLAAGRYNIEFLNGKGKVVYRLPMSARSQVASKNVPVAGLAQPGARNRVAMKPGSAPQSRRGSGQASSSARVVFIDAARVGNARGLWLTKNGRPVREVKLSLGRTRNDGKREVIITGSGKALNTVSDINGKRSMYKVVGQMANGKMFNLADADFNKVATGVGDLQKGGGTGLGILGIDKSGGSKANRDQNMKNALGNVDFNKIGSPGQERGSATSSFTDKNKSKAAGAYMPGTQSFGTGGSGGRGPSASSSMSGGLSGFGNTFNQSKLSSGGSKNSLFSSGEQKTTSTTDANGTTTTTTTGTTPTGEPATLTQTTDASGENTSSELQVNGETVLSESTSTTHNSDGSTTVTHTQQVNDEEPVSMSTTTSADGNTTSTTASVGGDVTYSESVTRTQNGNGTTNFSGHMDGSSFNFTADANGNVLGGSRSTPKADGSVQTRKLSKAEVRQLGARFLGSKGIGGCSDQDAGCSNRTVSAGAFSGKSVANPNQIMTLEGSNKSPANVAGQGGSVQPGVTTLTNPGVPDGPSWIDKPMGSGGSDAAGGSGTGGTPER